MAPRLAQRPRPDRTFERIYRRHVGDVYRYAFAVMRNAHDAEDITQTTFMNAYRAFRAGERPEKPQNWLIAIAHNVCRQRFRQSARRPTEVAFEDDVGATLVEPDDAPSGADIRRALGHLAFNQRAALVMRELEGRSYAEIAEILEVSTSAVETLIFRARRALREQLESALTCGQAELAISKQLDGRLTRPEKGALRAHLRECRDCATFARRQRAQRTALKSLAAIPLPSSLASFFGGSGATVGGGLAVKAALALTAGVAIGGAGYAGLHEAVTHGARGGAGAQRQAPPKTSRPRTPFADPGAAASSHTAHAPRPARKREQLTAQAPSGHARGHHAYAGVSRSHAHSPEARIAHVPRVHVQPPGPVTSHRPAAPPRGTNPHRVAHPAPPKLPARTKAPPGQSSGGNGGSHGTGHGK